MLNLRAIGFLVLVPWSAMAAGASTAPVGSLSANDAFLNELREYQTLLEEYKREVDYHLKREVEDKKASVNRSYDQVTNTLERSENERRLDAIARHREFIKRYPDHPAYTPDALFRLGELLYEKAQVDYNDAESAFDEQYALYTRGKIPRPPQAPLLSLNDTIALYEDLIKRFPTYRYIDSAYYLVGYCYLNMDKYDEAIVAYRILVDKFPKSRHIDEAWMRLGELNFDIGEWRKAIDAYQRVMEYPTSKWYELAFYKLAWSYFQDDQYDAAIKKFLDLLDFYAKKAEGSVITDERAQLLRSEVIEYIAKTLAEDDWDGDGQRDPDAGVQRGLGYLRQPRPSNREILQKYADTLYELHERPKYFEAIDVYKAFLDASVNDPDDPAVQERIIAIHDVLGDLDGGIRERGRMAELYGKGSAWYQANETNAKAIAKAEEYVDNFSKERALALHQLAQKTKLEAQAEGNDTKLAKAEATYREASAAYRDYLARYPQSPSTYEISLYLADTLYYSRQFEDAATYYEKVRDYQGKEDYLEYAANSAVVSMQDQIQLAIAAGRLPKWAMSKDIEAVEEKEGGKEKEGGIRRVTPVTVPDLLLHYIKNIDAYVARNLQNKDDPEYQGRMAYKAAEVFLRYKNYDEARKRFEAIIERYPQALVANYAAANIINTYWEENDIANVKRWAAAIEEKNIGKAEERKKWKEEIRTFEMGAQFKHAMELLEEKKHVEAADEFVSLVNANPDFEDADKALVNAALALQDAKRYEESARIFERIVTEERFKKSDLHKVALFNLSENYKRFYNFDKAIWGYTTLHDRYPKADEARYSLYQAAELLEYNQQFDEAIQQFSRYMADYRERDEIPVIAWRVVRITEKMGDERRLAGAWETFAKTQASNPASSVHVVECYRNLAAYYQRRGDSRQAMSYYQRTVDEYKKRNLGEGKAAEFAAEASFKMLEPKFQEYEAIKITGSLAAQGAAIQKKRKLLAELETKYSEILPYKAVDWTVAAFFRMGQVWQLLAKAVFDAPIPDSLDEEAQDVYRSQLEDIAAQWENTAIERYETTIQNARQLNVMNEWTKKTLEALNQYKPAEYPLFKEEKRFELRDLEER
jgi:TolA-binding protein